MRTAFFSECGRYRYSLTVLWDDRPVATIIMMNPSTATEFKDDPTTQTCIRQCRQLGFGGIVIVNLCGYVSSDPKVLKTVVDPVGPQNYAHVREAIERSHCIVCAWGRMNKKFYSPIVPMLQERKLYCFEITKRGYPHHPLRMKRCEALQPYVNLIIFIRIIKLETAAAVHDKRIDLSERQVDLLAIRVK